MDINREHNYPSDGLVPRNTAAFIRPVPMTFNSSVDVWSLAGGVQRESADGENRFRRCGARLSARPIRSENVDSDFVRRVARPRIPSPLDLSRRRSWRSRSRPLADFFNYLFFTEVIESSEPRAMYIPDRLRQSRGFSMISGAAFEANRETSVEM